MGRKQHTTPVFYLRLFSKTMNDNRELIHRFDKQKMEQIVANPRNVGAESYFYDDDNSVEDILTEIEGIASKIIYNIIDSESISDIQYYDKLFLVHWIEIQLVRTSVGREIWMQLFEMLKERHVSPVFTRLSADDIKREARNGQCRSILTPVNNNAEKLLDKAWFLIINETDQDFITSDQPVHLHGFHEIMEYPVKPDDSVFYPITPRLCIFMTTPEVAAFFKDPIRIQKYDDDKKGIIQKLNFSMVGFSKRYIYSKEDNSIFIESSLDLIKPEFRNPARNKWKGKEESFSRLCRKLSEK